MNATMLVVSLFKPCLSWFPIHVVLIKYARDNIRHGLQHQLNLAMLSRDADEGAAASLSLTGISQARLLILLRMREATQPVGADHMTEELSCSILRVMLRMARMTNVLPVPGIPSIKTREACQLLTTRYCESTATVCSEREGVEI